MCTALTRAGARIASVALVCTRVGRAADSLIVYSLCNRVGRVGDSLVLVIACDGRCCGCYF